MKKYIQMLILCCLAGGVTAQDTSNIGMIELMAAEKLFDLRFTPVKRDSIVSGLVDHLKFYQYLH